MKKQIKAATAVNVELLKFYWSLGADIVRLEKSQPIGVSEYRLAQLLPKEVESDLPSVSEIESGLKFPDISA